MPCNSARRRGTLPSRVPVLTLLPGSHAFRQHRQHVTRCTVQLARATGNLHLALYRLPPATYRPAHFSPAARAATVKYRPGFRGKQGISHRVKSLRAFYRARGGRKLRRKLAPSSPRGRCLDAEVDEGNGHLSIVCIPRDINRTRESGIRFSINPNRLAPNFCVKYIEAQRSEIPQTYFSVITLQTTRRERFC